MAASTSAVGNKCYNAECKELRPDRPRKGWRLRAGDFADLCDRCGSIYEEGKFCETFHPNESGWRCCESCGKRVHCGCVVSAQAFTLLDPGGIECVSCARKSYTSAPSTEAYGSKAYIPPIYDYAVVTSAHELMSILDESLSEESFAQMKFILANLHERTLPQCLSSACALLDFDFWLSWEEYEDACAAKDELAKHKKATEEKAMKNKAMGKASTAQGLHGEGTQIEAMRSEIVSIDAEIAKLQARRASLVEGVAHEEERHREQVRMALMKKEAESRKFSLHKISASRMEVKESVRRLAMIDLKLALDTLEECK